MMMILVNCGCCGVASGYGCAVWCTYGATTCWCTASVPQGGGARRNGGTAPGNCTVRGERRGADGERFCFTSRSWFGVCIAKISPKKLGQFFWLSDTTVTRTVHDRTVHHRHSPTLTLLTTHTARTTNYSL